MLLGRRGSGGSGGRIGFQGKDGNCRCGLLVSGSGGVGFGGFYAGGGGLGGLAGENGPSPRACMVGFARRWRRRRNGRYGQALPGFDVGDRGLFTGAGWKVVRRGSKYGSETGARGAALAGSVWLRRRFWVRRRGAGGLEMGGVLRARGFFAANGAGPGARKGFRRELAGQRMVACPGADFVVDWS